MSQDFCKMFAVLFFPCVWGFLKKKVWPPIRDVPTTTTTIFEFLSRRPMFQFWGTPGCRTKVPFLHNGTQRKGKDFPSDLPSSAVWRDIRRKTFSEKCGCGCGWALPDLQPSKHHRHNRGEWINTCWDSWSLFHWVLQGGWGSGSRSGWGWSQWHSYLYTLSGVIRAL